MQLLTPRFQATQPKIQSSPQVKPQPQFGNDETEAKIDTLRNRMVDEVNSRLSWALEEVPVNKIPSKSYSAKNHVAQATQKAAIIQAAATLAASKNQYI